MRSDEFGENDANAWFDRNEDKLSGSSVDSIEELLMSRLLPYLTEESRFLEIGCGNGKRLYSLWEKLGCACSGIDLSSKAIADGRKRFPELSFTVGNARSLPFPDHSFDFVYTGFFMYLVKRNSYYQVVSEVDRVLKPGGMLAILDFDVPSPYSNEFAPNKKLKSYKIDNSLVFISSKLYSLVDKASLSHVDDKFVNRIDERLSFQILYKETEVF